MSLFISHARGASLAVAALAFAAALPGTAQACACGCGIFDVGDGSVMPMMADSGFSVFYRFSSMVQNSNHEQGHAASPDDNTDKRIATDFHTIGAEIRLAPAWTLMAEVPIYDRHFTTTATDGMGQNIIETVPLTAAGDLMLRMTYSGFSRDMSSGVSLGIKLPTGRNTSPLDAYGNAVYDHDTLPGTGSTDLLLGAWHIGHFGNSRAAWFVQANYQFAVATQDAYRPGNEADVALGVSYDLPLGGPVKVAPVLQWLGSVRAHDSGANADPFNSGYQRLLIAPGVRVQLTRKLSLYGDVAFPVAQYVNAARPSDNADSMGQLAAPVLFKLQVNYGF